MNEETKLVRASLHDALEFVQQASPRDSKDVERAVSETGLLLQTLFPKWKGLVVSSLPEEDAAGLARSALHLLAQYELLIQVAEAKVGPLDEISRDVPRWRSFWADLAR